MANLTPPLFCSFLLNFSHSVLGGAKGMNVLLTGGTGFVGTKLTERLLEKHAHVYILTRKPEMALPKDGVTYIGYDANPEKLPSIDAVINLAGDSLFGYWTKRKKERILTSRVKTTKKVLSFIEQLNVKPGVFISASAVGYYGTSRETVFTEESGEHGDDFLATVVGEWEEIAQRAVGLGIRTVYARFGVILGTEGALPLMSLPIKLFIGGKIGSGKQFVSWVHIDDAVGLLLFALENEQISGPVNVTAPEIVRNDTFTKTLAKVLKRPYWFTTPAFLIRVSIGEMSILVTDGQHVVPDKALNKGYKFKYPTLKQALEEVYP